MSILFSKLGFEFNRPFRGDETACMVIDEAPVMLLVTDSRPEHERPAHGIPNVA